MTYKSNQSITPFLDVLFSLLICCLAIVLIVKHKTDEAATGPQYQAVYQIIMEWPAKSNDDIDLWARSPRGNIVGFNRREGGEGSLMSLGHDNLGAAKNQQGANLDVNQEIISIRGVNEGEYLVNIMAYTKVDATNTPVVVKLVRMKPFAIITTKTNVLLTAGDEITVFRFTLDKTGRCGNINTLQELVAQNALRPQ